MRPVVPPTVPPGEERVRVCLRAGMERRVVETLVKGIQEWTEGKMEQEVTGGRVTEQAVVMKAKL